MMVRLPSGIADSRLMRRGGFDIYEGLPGPAICQRLMEEALRLVRSAQESWVARSDDEEVRGGNPARRFLSAPGGETQRALYRAPWMLRLLQDLTGLALKPPEALGTYTYYARTGDFLDLHRDVESCEVAVITCLADGANGSGRGGLLTLYPNRLFEPLSVIRATAHRGAVGVRLSPGQTILMLGGIIPHRVEPVVAGQARIISVLCYQ